eukprot:TRINITY_DN75573_c0_g1_i1.p1 TRINITY_DN75573_c0_g1~~TRINITY_DN75573_c0_g1_i1.p1  ORF type:complete len:260 (-),score=32.03 TRINITY_DN75573_c0_g1_i1:35-814(-)
MPQRRWVALVGLVIELVVPVSTASLRQAPSTALARDEKEDGFLSPGADKEGGFSEDVDEQTEADSVMLALTQDKHSMPKLSPAASFAGTPVGAGASMVSLPPRVQGTVAWNQHDRVIAKEPTNVANSEDAGSTDDGNCHPKCIEGRGICNDNLCFCKTPWVGVRCEKKKTAENIRFSFVMVAALVAISLALGLAGSKILFNIFHEIEKKAAYEGEEDKQEETWTRTQDNKDENAPRSGKTHGNEKGLLSKSLSFVRPWA